MNPFTGVPHYIASKKPKKWRTNSWFNLNYEHALYQTMKKYDSVGVIWLRDSERINAFKNAQHRSIKGPYSPNTLVCSYAECIYLTCKSVDSTIIHKSPIMELHILLGLNNSQYI